ncbi:type II secretion system ATPase GspE [bacterium]|nr:type II secretion system ATPase GspE [bacterium]
MKPQLKLGEILLANKLVTEAQLSEILSHQLKNGKKLGKIIAEKKLVKDADLLQILSDHLDLPTVDLTTFDSDPEVVGLLSESFLRSKLIFPLFKIGDELTVAMVDPRNLETIDELRSLTRLNISPMLCSEQDLQESFNKVFKGSAESYQTEVRDAVKDYQLDVETIAMEENDQSLEEMEEAAQDTPIIRLSNVIISAAVKEGASDIHVEPEDKHLLVRFRIDGIMKESFVLDKHLQSALLSRFKIMSGLDIAEKRLPQDGRFQTRIGERTIDFRISSFPTVNGENIVMRILDKGSVLVSLQDLGFDKNTMIFFDELIHRPNGIILVTGPTGSGKTTTLYSALSSINSIDKNIITVEDPIEYRLDLIRQCQINSKIGLTFAAGLRSILRQDPDVIMVGEIRDKETAHIAVESALTGHLVFSTLHTNDAPSAINRLTDMGIEPFLTASAVSGILAQRLVRKLCPKCKEKFTPDETILKTLNVRTAGSHAIYRPKGCPHCKDKGYKGRLAIYELLMVNEDIKKLTMERASSGKIKDAAIENGMRTLRQDGIAKVLQGLTTVEEVLRVTTID